VTLHIWVFAHLITILVMTDKQKSISWTSCGNIGLAIMCNSKWFRGSWATQLSAQLISEYFSSHYI